MQCSICGIRYSGFGHNADPVTDRRCCGSCNNDVVVPARIRLGYEPTGPEEIVTVGGKPRPLSGV